MRAHIPYDDIAIPAKRRPETGHARAGAAAAGSAAPARRRCTAEAA